MSSPIESNIRDEFIWHLMQNKFCAVFLKVKIVENFRKSFKLNKVFVKLTYFAKIFLRT
jgi:hypothetical protein